MPPNPNFSWYAKFKKKFATLHEVLDDWWATQNWWQYLLDFFEFFAPCGIETWEQVESLSPYFNVWRDKRFQDALNTTGSNITPTKYVMPNISETDWLASVLCYLVIEKEGKLEAEFPLDGTDRMMLYFLPLRDKPVLELREARLLWITRLALTIFFEVAPKQWGNSFLPWSIFDFTEEELQHLLSFEVLGWEAYFAEAASAVWEPTGLLPPASPQNIPSIAHESCGWSDAPVERRRGKVILLDPRTTFPGWAGPGFVAFRSQSVDFLGEPEDAVTVGRFRVDSEQNMEVEYGYYLDKAKTGYYHYRNPFGGLAPDTKFPKDKPKGIWPFDPFSAFYESLPTDPACNSNLCWNNGPTEDTGSGNRYGHLRHLSDTYDQIPSARQPVCYQHLRQWNPIADTFKIARLFRNLNESQLDPSLGALTPFGEKPQDPIDQAVVVLTWLRRRFTRGCAPQERGSLPETLNKENETAFCYAQKYLKEGGKALAYDGYLGFLRENHSIESWYVRGAVRFEYNGPRPSVSSLVSLFDSYGERVDALEAFDSPTYGEAIPHFLDAGTATGLIVHLLRSLNIPSGWFHWEYADEQGEDRLAWANGGRFEKGIRIRDRFIMRAEDIFEHPLKPRWLLVPLSAVLEAPTPEVASIWSYGGFHVAGDATNAERFGQTFRSLRFFPYYNVHKAVGAPLPEAASLVWTDYIDDKLAMFAELNAGYMVSVASPGRITWAVPDAMAGHSVVLRGTFRGPWGSRIAGTPIVHLLDGNIVEPDWTAVAQPQDDLPYGICTAVEQLEKMLEPVFASPVAGVDMPGSLDFDETPSEEMEESIP